MGLHAQIRRMGEAIIMGSLTRSCFQLFTRLLHHAIDLHYNCQYKESLNNTSCICWHWKFLSKIYCSAFSTCPLFKVDQLEGVTFSRVYTICHPSTIASFVINDHNILVSPNIATYPKHESTTNILNVRLLTTSDFSKEPAKNIWVLYCKVTLFILSQWKNINRMTEIAKGTTSNNKQIC